MSKLRLAAGWLAALLLGVAATAATAQQQPGGDPLAQQQQQRGVEQPGNNAPVWREVQSGERNYTSIPGREAGVTIQPQARFPGQSVRSTAGEAWRNYRNGPVTVYGGWLLVIIGLFLAAFYVIKGPLKLHEKPSGRMIERFTAVERAAHWTMAISFVVLALSGLVMLFGKHVLLPVIGYTLFAWLAALAKNLHNFVGPVFILSVLVFVVLFIKDNLPSARDIEWLMKGGGLLSDHQVPSARFNAGEKVYFWGGVIILTVLMAVTGLFLLFPNFEQLRTTMQQMSIIHAIGGILYIAMASFHIYLGTIGMEGAYQIMRTGYADEAWAKEHHSLWYDEVKSRKPSAPAGAIPAGAPRARRDETGD